MGDEDGLGALEMGVGGYNGIAGGFCLGEKSLGPFGELADQRFDAVADVEAQVGGDLFVAAAASVQLEAEVANGFGEAQLDEVVNVLSLRIVADLVELRREWILCRWPSSPADDRARSSSVRTPAALSAIACARLAASSSQRSCQSKRMDRCH